MIEAVRGYLLRITAGAFAGAILLAALPKGTPRRVAAMLCGLLMLLLALTPLAELDYDSLAEAISRLELEKEEARTGIEIQNQELVASIISGRVQTYILDKASSLGMQISVELEMETRAATPYPSGVTIRGSRHPDAEAAAADLSGADVCHRAGAAGMAAVSGGRLAQLREQAPRLLKKYRLPLLIFLAGLILAAWPAGKKQETKSVPVEAVSGFDLDATTSQLEQLLSGIAGAGRVRLMLTLSGSEKTLYQTDSRTVTSAGSTTTQTETVFRQTGSSEKEPAAQSVLYPQYQGALVVCDGADSASVRLAIIQAVSSLTGLGSNKIAVVKMKGQ